MAHHQAALPPSYVHDIPSIHAVNAGLPAVLGSFDLNRSIQAGAPLDPHNISEAKSLAKGLRAMSDLGVDARVTPAVAESAELRATAVKASHALSIYTPIDIGQALRDLTQQLATGITQINNRFTQIDDRFAQIDDRFTQIDDRFTQINNRLTQIDNRLTQIDNRFNNLSGQMVAVNHRLDEVVAFSHNTRIISHNRITTPPNYWPLYKTVAGHGLVLATAAYGNVPTLMQHLVPPAQVPGIGTTPPTFSTDFLAYQRADLIRLIIFYNDDFGIVQGDSVSECVDKFYRFLSTY